MFLEQNSNVVLEIGEKDVRMYECIGKVHSICSFIENHYNILSEKEFSIIEKQKGVLKKIKIPPFLNKCLTRSESLAVNQQFLSMKRNGARSAYDEKSKIKFKGCRPEINSNSTFPIEKLDFNKKNIKYDKIPFGVLSKGGVLREILAYCFCLYHSIPISHEPICIYEYYYGDKSIGFCIILKSLAGEKRVEQLIEYPDISLKELIEITTKKMKTSFLIGSELRVSGININFYSEKKAKFLIKMHFNGGFRGILNSNIGNDIVDSEGNLFICDFDTFKIIEFPSQVDQLFLDDFVLSCLIEVFKSSLSILDFINFDEGKSLREKNLLLFKRYKEKSTLWIYYWTIFMQMINQMRWDSVMIEKAVENSLKTEAFHKIISLVLLNNSEINNMAQNRIVYYSHN